jgi:hypothetical protein
MSFGEEDREFNSNEEAKSAVISTFDLLIKKFLIYIFGLIAIAVLAPIYMAFVANHGAVAVLLAFILIGGMICILGIVVLVMDVKIYINLKSLLRSKDRWSETPHDAYVANCIRFSKFVIAYTVFGFVASILTIVLGVFSGVELGWVGYGVYMSVSGVYYTISVLFLIYAIYSIVASFIFRSRARKISI